MASVTRTRQQPASVSDAEWAAWRSFRRMNRMLERALEDRLQADAGISNADYGILLALWESPDHRLRSGEIARAIAWEKSRVSHQLGRLEQRDLIRREDCDDDLRGKWVVITHEGRRAVLSAMRDHGHALRENFFDHVSPEELAALSAVGERVAQRICPTLEESE